ncbi:DNA-directed DNA polymerase alpha catalytic subunit pol1 [Terramyces sp. JEL0728]|nr:DNA-directed DNA polymerase alpha catalytic subunit pol1 [Terramyces sp. JEL0728]
MNDYAIAEQTPIYDEVTEEEYNAIAKRAILEDDFVVDDNGEGYGRGIEDWDAPQSDSESDLEQDQVPKKRKKKKDGGIITALINNQNKRIAQQKVVKEIVTTEKENEFLSSIFNDIESTTIQKKSVAAKPKVKLEVRKPIKYNIEPLAPHNDDVGNMDFMDMDEANPVQVKVEDDFVAPVHHPVRVKEERIIPKVEIRSVSNTSSTKTKKFLPKFEQKESELVITSKPTDTVKWKEIKSDFNQEAIQEVGEVDFHENLYMFWIDAFEKDGAVYLFGKVESNGTFVSCCVQVKNIERNLFLLPRKFKLDDNRNETDYPVSLGDVYLEFDEIRKKYGIKEFASKVVNRKYAFELPGIPAESDFLKVLYSFNEKSLESSLTGKTFSKVFGTKTSALELLLLKRKIMGPCWLKIQNAELSTASISWCKLELVLKNPKDILNVAGDESAPKTSPPMVVMSLNLRTVMNSHKNVNEIVSVSALTYTNVNCEGESQDLKGSQFSILRQTDVPWPDNFENIIKGQEVKTTLVPNERALLSLLIANIQRIDPDILVGHNFIDFDLDVLLQRMKVYNIPHWSRIGRLKRSVWPKLQVGAGGTGDSSFAERQIAAGRILCDTYRAAKDLVNSKSFSLSYLSATQLKIERPDIEYDKIASYFWETSKLLEMIKHSQFDTWLATQLLFKLQFLPLTKQLTNLAGNLWSRTMSGARAERNEYLLLHQFHEKKYICPDKEFIEKQVTVQLNEDGDEVKAGGKRKAAYSGGLVLEPKKGLYDKYVLLLDFNSLYPSIIQEYNLCFTTVERVYDQDGDHMPEIPEDCEKGILPKLLATLVERRRAVKGLMKDPKISPQEYAQYDIRQKALKLTANSMYGCLGFVHSRFYAKPIAMLITFKGREILQNTVTLAESLNLEVIYGDTDSIMINTNSEDIKTVKKIGNELKQVVNTRYKLLEIEMDGMFKRLLLLKKKKYAAIVAEEKDGKINTSLETKGLDIVRRDWCDLSHDVSGFALNQILSSESREDAVEKIHQYLVKVGDQVRAKLVPPEKYVINKGLTKKPEEYADKHAQPHVQVALRMKKNGGGVKVGDTIPYVICKGSDANISQRAHHIDELLKEGSELEIDIDWYLANQVHPPISRLCAPIEGTDNARLAECLGLDVAKYQQISSSRTDEIDLFTLDSQLDDQERFKNVDKFQFCCVYCNEQSEFSGIIKHHNDGELEDGFVCQNIGCQSKLPLEIFQTQLILSIRKCLEKYLDQYNICEDPTCNAKTRANGVMGRKCIVSKCQGFMKMEYGDRDLYNQLQYFKKLFQANHLYKLYPQSKGK